MMQGDMKTLLSASMFFIVASLCLQLNASPIYPDCIAGSLASYEAGGSNDSSCAIGGSSGGVEIIDGFQYSGPSGDGSLIQLTPNPVGLGGGFIYSGFPSAAAGQSLTFDIGYFYTIDAGPIGSGADLGMDPPTGNVSITESVCVDSFFTEGGCTNRDTPQSLSVDNTNPPTSLTAQILFNPVATFGADVEIQVVETGCTTPGCTSVSGFDNTTATQVIVPATPEPVASLLCLGGLIAIGIFRRRFSG
jgi:hypothetical protein